MNYIGSKYSLLEEIETVLTEARVPWEGVALDLFAGTGAVAQWLKLQGFVTYANDWQRYAYVTNLAFVEHNRLPTFESLLADDRWGKRIRAAPSQEIATYSIVDREPLPGNPPCAQVLSYLNQLPGRRGPFYEAYCQGGRAARLYYARENGQRIQAIRDQIKGWADQKLISAKEKGWLIACLIEAADRVANTASVYGAYLKQVKRSAQKRMQLVALRPIDSAHPAHRHRVFCQDGTELLKRFEPGQLRLIYVDPPYNQRQYAANYHVLETITRWDLDQFEPRGVTGLRRAAEKRSDFCSKRAVHGAFYQLLSHIRSDYVLFSYNNEGLLSRTKLIGLFHEFCSDVRLTQIKFKRFRADVDGENRNYKTDHTHEFLILGKPKRSH